MDKIDDFGQILGSFPKLVKSNKQDNKALIIYMATLPLHQQPKPKRVKEQQDSSRYCGIEKALTKIKGTSSRLFLFSLLEVSAYTLTTTSTTRNNNNNIGSPTTTTTNDRRRNTGNRISSLLLVNQKGRNIEEIIYHGKKKRKCLCPPEDDNDDKDEDDDMLDAVSLLNEDRREVLFAMMGSMWSISAGNPQPVYATYGMDAKIELPDVIAGMNDRQNKQCLVESLGNRECLVYKETDPNKLLYKLALNSLDLIPSLVETKKWNDINSILIGGPMGQLSLTLNLLS
ncbi:hypothetical protein FRACYDRAFT_238502 [Fragilariopsis cylindrus CCMP1102]|uniref:Uncharacterized protein n=1 Tax=Fragilariopsis cylindrus CCMP1102 TaxID=635003 RepID=A0A1E7FIQ6_9STRA|nr:hypothetical protein FRACYDRAFT_238502 [Fragilariopsis cylindrus CCMP1102]|eukprot:OEU18069.1 hypothetical protein FRACYDRAFT_238502 [Fragilariopsis cylindrus CCMP1102]